MPIRLSACIFSAILILGQLRPASAQIYPECKLEYVVGFAIPKGTAKVRFSYRIPIAVPIQGNRWFIDDSEDIYTYPGEQSFEYNATAGGTVLAALAGSIQLNPYHYPCDYFRFLGCYNPKDVIPGTYTEGSYDTDVSSLTAAGDLVGISTFTQILGKMTTHSISPGGWASHSNSCAPQVHVFLDITPLPPQPVSDFQISVKNVTSNARAEVKPLAGPVTANIPLGTRFTLSLQRIGPPIAPVSANFSLGTATLQKAQIDPTLYPSAVLLEFNTGVTSEEAKTFQAVHLGTQTVVITPDDGSAAQLITVKVAKPKTLGTTHQTVTVGSDSCDLDAKIVEWADKRGIPPQLIKGIIDRETGSQYKPMEWRYEPLTTDWDNFAPPCPSLGLGPNVCQNQRSLSKYAPYRMEYDPAHPRGTLLVDSEDVHPRSIFNSTAGVPFDDSQQLVTVYEIVSQNTRRQGWTRLLGDPAKQLLLMNDMRGALSWPANTTLASSYGLMQVLFGESFENNGYAGISGQRRPFYLFDVPSNVAAGAGSIPVGSGVYIFKYRWENNFNVTREYSPQYDSPAKLDDDYKNGLFGYNGSFCDSITVTPPCYGPDTMNRIKNYPPIAATSIFP